MKKLLVLALLVSGLMTGCAGTRTSTQPPASPAVVVGDTPNHIDPSRCVADARRVIDQERLVQISGCDFERVRLADGSSASYVVIRFGPGMDCPSGCIYERKAAMVLPDRIAILPEPFMDNRAIHDRINSKLKVALPDDFLKHSDRHFVEQNGQWQMVLTFHKYLDGTVVINPTSDWETGVEIHATPAGS